MNVNFVCMTDGSGLWSNERRMIKCYKVEIRTIEDYEEEFGELRIYFTSNSWNVRKHGLIYTDGRFLQQLEKRLKCLGFNVEDLSYSEQGMQGEDYVSCDVGKAFLKSAKKLGLC